MNKIKMIGKAVNWVKDKALSRFKPKKPKPINHVNINGDVKGDVIFNNLDKPALKPSKLIDFQKRRGRR